MKKITIIFPHQLYIKHPALKKTNVVYIVEEYLFFQEFKFHKGKLAYHRAGMKSYTDTLSKKHEVNYIGTTEKESDIRKLIPTLAKQGVEEIHYMNPTDFWLEKRIKEGCKKSKIETVEHENKMFINSKEDLKTFFKEGKRSFFQTSFYKQQRVKRQILLEGDDEPVGGKWSFDGDNRKKFPRSATVPQHFIPKSDKYWKEAVEYVNKNFSKNPGALSEEALYPYTHAEAKKSLKHFFEYRFHLFGDYEDAIVKEVSYLHHSVLTPMLNVGLLEPMEVVKAAIAFATENDVPLNSLEGFVRQIMGWREFIRGMYEAKGVYSRTKNYWGFDRKIPDSFYNGTTGIPPVDDTIKKVLQTGYCHHIERLMILGNFMLLCEFHPKEVYRWFMELFIDAYDWVMVPNVYGMSQFADGGTFATKPYISGSNYIFKMSNYKKGEWHKTWDGLFWRFMDVHRDFFLSNPRLGMLVKMYDKMNNEKKASHHEFAEDYLSKLG